MEEASLDDDQRKRSRWRRGWRWRITASQLLLALALGSYRVWAAASSSSFHFVDPGSRNARRLGENLELSSASTAIATSAAATAAAAALPDDPSANRRHCGAIGDVLPRQRCDHARRYCRSGRGVVNYVALHFCALGRRGWISVPLLLALLVLAFFALAETADKFFSPVATLVVEILRMSPTMGGVTLLALGNGAPDVFASMAAIGGGNSRIGLGAIVSAGTFVSAFVLGSVALVAAPFSVKPLAFVRDVGFYLLAVGLVFLVYLKGVVTLWQAVGLITLYALFIVVVVVMDRIEDARRELELDLDLGLHKSALVDESYVEVEPSSTGSSQASSRRDVFASFWDAKPGAPNSFKLRSALEAPLHVILRATIPETNPMNWSRAYSTANFVFCPLLLLVMLRSIIAIDYPVTLFFSSVRLPLWSLVLVQNLLLAAAFLVSAKDPPRATSIPVAFLAFVMSVFWISFIASELLNCLAALGIVLGLSPALLGLTILAWGNSMGDLVADIAIARAGKPEMAIAGCFAGPMFNMLVGLGSALVIHTSYLEPPEYYLSYHPSLFIAFGFLSAGLLGSLVVVTWCKFQVTRTWGLCLIGLYFTFTLVSLVSASAVH